MDSMQKTEIEDRLKTIDDTYSGLVYSLDSRATDDITWMRSTLRELLNASDNRPSLTSSATQPHESPGSKTPSDGARQIKQIIPATDWQVVYLTDAEPYFSVYNLYALALVGDSNGKTEVVALDTDMEGKSIVIAQEQPGFHMLIHKDSVTEEVESDWSDIGRQNAASK